MRFHRIEMVGDLDIHAAEEFALEIQRLAKLHRIEIRNVATAAPAGRKVDYRRPARVASSSSSQNVMPSSRKSVAAPVR